MDGYPAGSLDHNVPLIVASGLNSKKIELELSKELQEQGILLRSELPPLESREADVLEEHFKEIDDKGTSWAGVGREEPYRLRIKTVGRSFLLPPRRARLPESIEPLESTPILHSPFSPLSPVSSLYPDGLVDAQWMKKHQNLIPSVYACFYPMTSDPTSTTLQDNRLKVDINNIKGALVRSGYKTRVAVILLGDDDGSPHSAFDGVSDRLDIIRKGTGLDPKSIFFVPPQGSPAELKRVIDSVLSVLYSGAIEYYRDLGRHARKKRSRGIAPQPTVPPTSGTSQTLSLSDWNFRYDFKSALFAEFRQEPDVAIRSFEQAYEILLGQDVLDIIPSWSPRWNEARLLSDIISIRCLRLHLWMGHTSLAVRRWQAHRDRISDFVDRRGQGTNNYGWQAWEARWATVMANLIEKIEIPGLAPSTTNLFLQPEKVVLGERMQPWELLHHTGYWYRIAARHLAARRTLAHMMPEEDRNAPDTSPASHVASKAYMYDTYMCPAPHQEYPIVGKGVNHAQLIVDCLITARTQFQARKQLRIAAELSMECAREMASMESWNDVVAILRPLWEDMSFRTEGWLGISEELGWLLRRAAAQSGRGDVVVAIDWELMSKKFTRRPHWHYDISKSLDGITPTTKPTVSMTDDAASSFVSASFVFRSKESKAGNTCIAQLSLKSDALPNAVPITLTSVRVEFEGSLRPIILDHDSSGKASSTGNLSISSLTLTEESEQDSEEDLPARLRGQCDLTLKPGQRRVFEMMIPLREAGEVEASSVVLSYGNKAFDLDYTLKFRETDKVVGWFVEGSDKPRHLRNDARILQIEPRPPKMEIKLVESLGQYYANEMIELRFELLNAEDEAANVKLDVHVFAKDVPSLRVLADGEEQTAEGAQEESKVAGLSVGRIESSASLTVTLMIDPAAAPTTYDVHLRASYHLESDAATPIMQMFPIQLNVVNAFEANYDLLPRLHPEPWPSLFDYEGLLEVGEAGGAAVQAKGFAQRWCLVCRYASFALEDLTVVGVEMKVVSCVGGARCNVVKRPDVPEEGITVSPRTMYEAQFDLTAQKMSLDDRQPVSLDLAFIIKWKRHGMAKISGNGDSDEAPTNTTTMLVGQYLVLGTEPRVLASVAVPATTEDGDGSDMMQLDMTIENPSNHFLTFGLTMEPSDTFAFSGAKQTTVHLLPMSRRTTTYRLLPVVRGAYVRPGLVVRDKYFQKVLRVIPTEGMKIDKDGLLIWVPGEGGEEEGEGEAEEGSDVTGE